MVFVIKRILTAMLLAGAIIVIVMLPAVRAEETGVSEPISEQQESSEGEDKTDRAKGRDDRIKKYQERKTEKLEEAKAKRVEARCKTSQGKVSSLRGKLNNVVANRSKVYKSIGEKLDAVALRLQEAGVDTTKLDVARRDVAAELKELEQSMQAYDEVLSDIEAMDCLADPTTYISAIEQARELQKLLREQATEFRRFATTELRQVLQELRQQLESQQSTESTVNSEEGTN
jgi:hypothetical protein